MERDVCGSVIGPAGHDLAQDGFYAVAERSIHELPRSPCREKATGREFDAVRVNGWIVWDSQGPNFVSDDEFERYYETGGSTSEPAAGE